MQNICTFFEKIAAAILGSNIPPKKALYVVIIYIRAPLFNVT